MTDQNPTTNGTPPRRTGRLSKCTPEMVARICECLGKGLNYAQAAEVVGINDGTIYKWKANNEEFRQTLARAEVHAVEARLETILAASKQSWQAAAWWLERRYPEQWGRRYVNFEKANQQEAEKPDTYEEKIARLRGVFGAQGPANLVTIGTAPTAENAHA